MVEPVFAIISPDMAPARHYFLETIQRPQIIWGIRILCIVSAVAALLIYKKMRDHNGD